MRPWHKLARARDADARTPHVASLNDEITPIAAPSGAKGREARWPMRAAACVACVPRRGVERVAARSRDLAERAFSLTVRARALRPPRAVSPLAHTPLRSLMAPQPTRARGAPPLRAPKTVARVARDVALLVRGASLPPPSLWLLCAPLLLLVVVLFVTASRRHISCTCPAPASAALFERVLLPHARFVARVVRVAPDVFRAHTLFDAPFPLLRFTFVVSPQRLSFCARARSARAASSFLVVARDVQRHDANQTALLLPFAPDCGYAQPERVFLYPWHQLSHDVRDFLNNDLDADPHWWRNANAVRASTDVVRSVLNSSYAPHYEQWWLQHGISVVAACKDRSQSLLEALPTWLHARGVDQVVLIDWSSSPSVASVLPSHLRRHPKLLLVNVLNQPHWVLSAAYNLAVRIASRTSILKVDCDTVLQPDFFDAHQLQHNTFFAGDWHKLDTIVSEKLHANGLLYVSRQHFLAVGGYDERITTYGWDDSDIVSRLSALATPNSILYDKIAHIPHNATLRVANSYSILPAHNPHAAAVEIQRNRILLTRFHLPPWRASSLHTLWNIQREYRHATHDIVYAHAASAVTPALHLISDADSLDVSKRAIRLVLKRYGVDLLPKSLSLDFYKQLADKVALASQYANVVFSLRGGCVSRLLAHIQVKQATSPASAQYISPPESFIGWRIQEVWHFPTPECSCKFSTPFMAIDEELTSTWYDVENPMRPSRFLSESRYRNNVPLALSLFDELSVRRNISALVAQWSAAQNETKAPRIMFASIACHSEPSSITEERKESARAQLRAITPSQAIVEVLEGLDLNPVQCLLDSPLLNHEEVEKYVQTGRVQLAFDKFLEPSLLEMATKWSPAFFPQHYPHAARRARSLYGAMYLSEKWASSAHDLNDSSISMEHRKLVSKLSTRVAALFNGCVSTPYRYLDAYPELAIIVASFICSRICV